MLSQIKNLLGIGINQYIDEIKNLTPDKVDSKLKQLYKTLSSDDFYNLIITIYKDLDHDEYVQKLIDTYRKFSHIQLVKDINKVYSELPNIVQVGEKKYKLSTLISEKKSDTNYYYGATGDRFPPSLDMRNDLLGVRDQGKDGCCVAFSLTGMKEYQEIKEKSYTSYLSPWFIFLLRGNLKVDGMIPNEALDILKNFGVCTENEFPYVKANSKNDITSENYNSAKNFRIKDYAYLTNINDMKKALNENGPCLIGLPCFNSTRFFWKKSSINDSLLGGHCVLAVGYDSSRGFLIRNSWGSNWGEFGYTWFPYEDWGLHNEAWTSINSLQVKNINTMPVLPITPFKNKQTHPKVPDYIAPLISPGTIVIPGTSKTPTISSDPVIPGIMPSPVMTHLISPSLLKKKSIFPKDKFYLGIGVIIILLIILAYSYFSNKNVNKEKFPF